MEQRPESKHGPSRIWFTSFGASQLLQAMTRDHFNGGLQRKLRTHRKWEMSQQEGSFLWVSLNVTLEWALHSQSQNRIKIWNQEFAHKGAFTGSWLGMPAEVQPQAWTQCSPSNLACYSDFLGTMRHQQLLSPSQRTSNHDAIRSFMGQESFCYENMKSLTY